MGRPVDIAEMPPISNPLLYAYRVLMKWLSFFLFGLACILLIALVFPVALRVLRPLEKFQKRIRRFIYHSMRCFVGFMHAIAALDVEVPEADRKVLQNLSSKIIVANHPSLLDVIMLFSLVPNADCIVQSYVTHTIMRAIVRQLYIPNNLSFRDLVEECTASLNQGNCLIIFPEGTRTPRTGEAVLKKGAARIALLSGYDIVPVHIGGSDKYGLGKKDPWTGFNHTGRYVYRISAGAPLSPLNYAMFPLPRAVRLLNKDIRDAIIRNTPPRAPAEAKKSAHAVN
jgi:1-acyl-sn-glycerol-3-phosphate acyltransferase